MNVWSNYPPYQGSISPQESGTGFFRIYLVAVAIIILSFVYLDIPNYIDALGRSILPKYFYYALFASAAPFLLLRFKTLIQYLISPFALWVFAMVLINSVDLIVLADSDGNVASLIATRNQFLLLALFFGFVCSIVRVKFYEWLFPVLTVAISLMLIVDFVSPGIFYSLGTQWSVIGRASAMFINPTRAAEALLIVCLLSIPVIRLQYRMPFLLLVGVGIIVTFSRGPILVWALLCLFLLLTRGLPRSSLIFIIILSIVLPSLFGWFKFYLLGRADFGGNLGGLLTRLDFFQAPALTDSSAFERLTVLKAGWTLFLQNPFFGAGSGATSLWSLPVSTHNQIVMLAAEHGIFGIGLWISLVVILWKGKYFQDRRLQFTTVIGFVLLSVFTHNMFDDLYWLVTFALVSGKSQAK